MLKNSGVWARFCIASVWCRLPGTDDAGKKTVLPAPGSSTLGRKCSAPGANVCP